MPVSTSDLVCLSPVIEIGGMPIRVNTTNPKFAAMLADRYEGFIASPDQNTTRGPNEDLPLEFDVELTPEQILDRELPVHVTHSDGRWRMQRGDFLAEWEPKSGRGTIRQSANPYSIDAVLRISHTLVLARQGGMLLHAASAIRNGKAFIFAGVSGAGKTTISRLAPKDVTLLTDEISYVRKAERGYTAFGTPFAGEMAKLGENVSAPLETLFFLAQGPENRIDEISRREAVRLLLANILFFAEDPELVRLMFQSACDFIDRVRTARLTFVPDSRVWEMVQ